MGWPQLVKGVPCEQWVTAGRWPALAQAPFFYKAAAPFSILMPPFFFHMWSTLSHWFQHMPA
jgi:hypothetical protein